jgi:TPR repeat protein
MSDADQTYKLPQKGQRASEDDGERDADGAPTAKHDNDNGDDNESVEQEYQGGLRLFWQEQYMHSLNLHCSYGAASHVDAMVSIGFAYHHGHGVEKNRDAAIYWYECAAKVGNRRAMSNLALLFEGERSNSNSNN